MDTARQEAGREWIAAYYPCEIIQDQRPKTLFCLLYDKVICHFPIANMSCGSGSGISEDFADDALVEAGVLELREEFLLDEIEQDFSPGHSWGTTEEFDRYCNLQVTGMALRCCEQENAVPVTDRAATPVPISVLGALDLKRAAGIQASALAIQSVDLALPAFAALQSNDILEARERLKDQLVPFRSAMFALAPKVRSAMSANAPITEVYAEARYLVETDVLPRLVDLKRRLALERGTFWRKLILRTARQLPSMAMKWISGAGVSGAMDAARLAGGAAAQAIDNEKLAHELLSKGGLGYLLSLQSEFAQE